MSTFSAGSATLGELSELNLGSAKAWNASVDLVHAFRPHEYRVSVGGECRAGWRGEADVEDDYRKVASYAARSQTGAQAQTAR
jgi:hypothetical protein